MPRAIHKLTDTIVRGTKLKAGRHSDGGGLYLNVGPTGTKSWLFMSTRDGKRREMGMGSYPAVTLAAARERAAEYRKVVAAGGDPMEHRATVSKEEDSGEDAAKVPTFGDAAARYMDSIRSEWRNPKHEWQWGQTLGDAYCKDLRTKPVSEVTTDDVLAVLEPIWTTKAETATRLRGRIERVLDFAKSKGWRTGENPALWRGHLKNILPRRPKLQRGRMAAMPYPAVPAFVQRLRGAEALAARALELVILTATRSNEALGARWDEIDFAAKVWTIPAERTKTAEKHEVPLSTRAIELLKQLRDGRTSEYVFPANGPRKPRTNKQGKAVLSANDRERPLSNMSMLMMLRRWKLDDVTVHGFRSSFRDWCGDATDFPRELAEAALAHRVGSEVERAYRRSTALEKRRVMMQDWCDFVTGTTAGTDKASEPSDTGGSATPGASVPSSV